MGLADRLTAPAPRLCRVGRILNDLPTEDACALAEALADARWTDTAIVDALIAEGRRIARSTVNNHRRAACACGVV